MKILAVNCGSSSLKFKLYEMPEEEVLISGTFERIGIDNSFYTIKMNGVKTKKEVNLRNHSMAVKYLCDELLDNNIIKDLKDIRGVGHRIVQGLNLFDRSYIVDDEVKKKIESLIPLAPLHNGPAFKGIEAFEERIPSATNVVVFDTSFHQTMPQVKYMYPLPFEYYEKYDVRKYGAHGTSHKYLVEEMEEYFNTRKVNLITCHIGSGASISAIKDSKVLDTSMGFTPLAGLMMGTRCGDIDVSVVPYILKKEDITINQFLDICNNQSGLLGISGISSDSRDIEEAIKQGNSRAKLAQDMMVDRIVSYIARYYVALEGKVDAIVFSAGIGENSIVTRKEVIEQLKCFGIKLDSEANNSRGEFKEITTKSSKIPCFVVPTDEEVMIARDTLDLIK